MKKSGNRASKIWLYFGIIVLLCSATLIAMGLIIDARILWQLFVTVPIGILLVRLGMKNLHKSERDIRSLNSSMMPAVDEREKELIGRAAYISWWFVFGLSVILIYVYAMLSAYAGFDPSFLWWIAAFMWIHGFSMPIIYAFLSRKS